MGFEAVNPGWASKSGGEKFTREGGTVGVRRKRVGKAGQPPTVLVVEPRAADLEQTRLLLAEAGFRVVPVTRFDAAVPLFEVIRPAAVLLAAQAPDFAAVQVVRRLRQLSHGAVPLLYLVDERDAEARRYCLERGQCVDLVPRSGSGSEMATKLHAQLKLKDAVLRAAAGEEAGTAQALHDPVTGLYNRPFLLEFISLEARRAERYGGGFSVVAAEVGGWSAFRKEFGRGMAERLLVYSAVVLGQTVRDADAVARVGDCQFALMLPGTPAESVQEVVTRVAARFDTARFQVEGKVVRTSLELGTVSFPDSVGTPTQLLSAAQQDMRRAREYRRMVGSTSRLSV
ncbi:diguanylate cyclase response regulator [Myxococcus xanthus]|uniref:GGDEF domain-containing protein n=1 Tax=Myxococcus xanthus TaxID=34 RepID=UPI00112A7B44|nr:diguanylate cyclase [Myxococcus xanthus]QDE90100.1 diguanylate cyclase response regulator [Myxococcus xanthus]